jgi:3-oxoacyl-(acyl-carrier-protein) synthase
MAAISSAVEGLIENDFDMAVCGGIDRNMGASTFVKFSKIGALSASGTRPYAEGADGFVMGEGAAIFLLKRLADAEHDGDNIYAVLRGIAGSSDGKGKGITAPNPIGQKFAIERAWQNAGLSPATATLMEGHGTSTSVGDVVEVQSMADVLSSFHLPTASVALGSVKSNIGHLKGAAGAAGLLKATLALRDKVLPPSVNCENPNPNIDFAHSPLYVNTELRPWTVSGDNTRRAGLSAFGFGGTNFHAVLEEYIPGRLNGNGKRTVAVTAPSAIGAEHSVSAATVAPATTVTSVATAIPPVTAAIPYKAPLRGALVIGAASDAALVERLQAIQKEAAAGRAPAPIAPAESDLRAPERLVIDYADAADLADKSAKALKALKANQAPIWKALRPQGIFRGRGTAGKVAFLYTGQGSQYVNMLEPLRAVEPIVAETFTEADRIMTPLLNTLYDAGARVFVEVGPKKALQGFAEEVLGERGDVISLFTNHPKVGDVPAFNHALCALYAAGLGRGVAEVSREIPVKPVVSQSAISAPANQAKPTSAAATGLVVTAPAGPSNGNSYDELGRLFAETLQRAGWQINRGENPGSSNLPVAITGASLGLPGTEHIFDDSNIERILRGDQFISAIPARFRQDMLDKHIKRLVKSDKGEATFESITDVEDVIKLAGRGGAFDLESEFGVPSDHLAALDRVTCLAIGAGIDALRDAGIPLVMRYKTTTKGTQLPDRWGLPDGMRDDTGVIFGSAFPGYDSFAEIMGSYYEDHARREQLETLESLRARATGNGHSDLGKELDQRIQELRLAVEKQPYVFDRRFLLRVLSMGHSQFAELIGARGPNTQINAACATTAQGVALAEDWIRAGRCRRVIVISADDVTSDNLIDWMGAGFLAIGAAATDEKVEDAAIPFDRRRHGLIMGMGAAALVVESLDAARERGIQPICEVLSAVTANSAFHGTRLDVQHIGQVMEGLVAEAETCSGVTRNEIAPKMVFVSHETYTPARGGSASAEIHALRRVFGDNADQIVIANTKGMTGHAMGTGIEDVLAVKALETGLVPPVANFKEVDPELGSLNLSKGGTYPIEYAIHLGAGFGSQISMILLRWVPTKDGVRPKPNALGYAYRIADKTAWNAWLSRMADRPVADLEVVHRTLRVRDQGLAARIAGVAKEPAAVPASTPKQPVRPEARVPAAASAASVPAKAVATNTPVKKEIPGVTATVSPAKAREETKAPVPVPALTSAGNGAGESVKERILELMVEKTGYPRDMLDVDLDLEADLGVDTVKQAEMFAAIREIYNIPRDENRKLRDYPTLAHVIRFVYEKRPDLVGGTAPSPTTAEIPAAVATTVAAQAMPPVTPAANCVDESVKERILELMVEKTGYPKDMLDVDLDLEADLGVDTVKQAEMFAAIREIYNIPRDENRKLRDYPTLAHVIRFVYEKRPDLAGGTPSSPKTAETTVATPSLVTAQPIPPVTSSVNGADESVKDRILELMVEKTGYPKDMLDVDLDLEADLGVDTVKQAEMFAAIREIYNIPRDENRKLRDYPTLAHVIRFVYEKRPDLAGGTAPSPTTVEVPAAVPIPVTAQPTPPVTSSVSGADESVKERILELMVEKTGYPKDMLDVDLDLEADLGVDTVKQAEMFAAIREIYNIPRDENRKLRDYPTLAHVIRFVYEKRPDLAGAAPSSPPLAEPPAPEPATVTAPAVSDDSIKEKVLDIVAEKTGYPKDMLDLDLDLEADLGIDTVKQAEMFAAIRGAYNIPRDENLKLRDFPTLAHVIQFAQNGQRRGKAPAATVPTTTTSAWMLASAAASPASVDMYLAMAPSVLRLPSLPASMRCAVSSIKARPASNFTTLGTISLWV